MACHGAIKVSPYKLVYGHDTLLTWEIKTSSRWIFSQDQLTTDDYTTLMKDELEDLAGHRLKALISIEENKRRVARWYDKRVKAKEFAVGDLVWKLILPTETKSSKFGKWSPNWEDPYQISQSAPGNAYIMETLEGERRATLGRRKRARLRMRSISQTHLHLRLAQILMLSAFTVRGKVTGRETASCTWRP